MNKAWWGLPLSGVLAKITMTKILVTSAGNARKSCMILTCIQLSPNDKVFGKEFLYIKNATKTCLRQILQIIHDTPNRPTLQGPLQHVAARAMLIQGSHSVDLDHYTCDFTKTSGWASWGPTKYFSPRWCMFFPLEGKFPRSFWFFMCPQDEDRSHCFLDSLGTTSETDLWKWSWVREDPRDELLLLGELTARFYLLAHHLRFEKIHTCSFNNFVTWLATCKSLRAV